MRSFAASDRFVADVKARKMAPGYVFIGDEAFFRKRCRDAILQHLIPADVRELSVYDLDLGDVELQHILDQARTPSLMSPFQVFFIRGVKNLYGRGKHDDEFGAIEDYFKNPNPDALLVFVADHINIPTDVRRMDLTDKDRYERIRDTLGEYCTVLEFARVDESDAVKWAMETAGAEDVKLDNDAARELVDSLGSDMMMVANELEKLVLFVGDKKRITLGDVETLVLAAKQRSFYELTDAISAHDRGPCPGCARRHPQHRRRRRSCHRPPVHAGAYLPPDAGDPGTECARLARVVAGFVAGLPHSAVRRGRHHSPGAALQVPPRTDQCDPASGACRSGVAIQPSQQDG